MTTIINKPLVSERLQNRGIKKKEPALRTLWSIFDTPTSIHL